MGGTLLPGMLPGRPWGCHLSGSDGFGAVLVRQLRECGSGRGWLCVVVSDSLAKLSVRRHSVSRAVKL